LPIVRPTILKGRTLNRIVFEGGTHNETPIMRWPGGDTYELSLEEMRTYLKLIGVTIVDEILDTLWNMGYVVWYRDPERVCVKSDPPRLAEMKAEEFLRKCESEGRGKWTPSKI